MMNLTKTNQESNFQALFNHNLSLSLSFQSLQIICIVFIKKDNKFISIWTIRMSECIKDAKNSCNIVFSNGVQIAINICNIAFRNECFWQFTYNGQNSQNVLYKCAPFQCFDTKWVHLESVAWEIENVVE